MKEIGGYPDFSSNWRQNDMFPNAYYFNSARHSLEYLLCILNYKEILFPFYTCQTLLPILKRTKVTPLFYHIDKQFMPIIPDNIKETPLFYTNYYGLMNENTRNLTTQFSNIIIDNAQAYFSIPLPNVNTIYSPRKFFGLPDGGFLYPTNNIPPPTVDYDISFHRCTHLLQRLDCGATSAYALSVKENADMASQPVLQMSKLTRILLQTVDTEHVCKQRCNNWEILSSKLSHANKLNITRDYDEIPLFYPYISYKPGLRKYLISKGIYIAKYWPDLEHVLESNSWEHLLCTSMLPIPLDQRYSTEDMQIIINEIYEFEKTKDEI